MALKAKTTTRVSEGKTDALIDVTKEKTVRLNANLSESLYQDLKIKAAKENTKINDLVIGWVKEYLSN